jgi:hypothetical protein
MSEHSALWSAHEVEDYARIETLETFDVPFFSGKILRNLFPQTTIRLKPKPAPPDYLDTGSILAVSDRLRAFLETERIDAEFIELQVLQNKLPVRQRYYFMNCLAVIPCMDKAKSRYDVFRPESGGGIKTIHELYLDESKIQGRKLFVLEEKINILVRRDLIDALRANGFTGLMFRPLPIGPF